MNEEEKQLPCEDAGEGFEELIRGRYKEQFDARVQKILDGRLKNLRRENERLRESGQAERRLAIERIGALESAAEDIRRDYPGFDWQQEMRDTTFGALILAGIDGRSAYEMVHRDALREAAAQEARLRTEEDIARSMAGGRVAENGGQGAAVLRGDPRTLTSRELSDIRRRVQRGEKIRF